MIFSFLSNRCYGTNLILSKWELLFNFNLTGLISGSKRGLQIICLRSFTSTSPREALVQCLAVCPRYATQKLDTRACALHCRLRTLMGYPSYARNRTCAWPPPSPFHCVMAKIVPVVQLAAHAKSSTLYGRSYGRTSKFFQPDGFLLFRIIMGLPCACY